jgi:hypothetical protein
MESIFIFHVIYRVFLCGCDRGLIICNVLGVLAFVHLRGSNLAVHRRKWIATIIMKDF